MYKFALLPALISTLTLTTPGIAADLTIYGEPEADMAEKSLQRGGFVSVGAGWTFLSESNDEANDETDDQSYPSLRIEGVFSQPLSTYSSVQVDLGGEIYDTDGGPDRQRSLGFAGLHLSARDPYKGLVGLFAGVSHGQTANIDQENTGQWVGLETQKYFENVTLYAQGGFAIGNVHSSPDEGFDRGYFARAVARYFVNDDFRIQAEASFLAAEDAIDASDEIYTYGWGLRADKRIGTSRFYGYASYNGLFLDTTTEGEELTEHALRLGFSRQFGPATLFEQDRYGATLDQPEIVARTTNWIEPLD